MMPLAYFVRHGETDWNAEGRLQGQADTDINDIGRRQAARNGHRLAALIDDPNAFDFVASPMRRTRETMECVRAAMGLDQAAYRTEVRLIEVHFGDWQGQTFAEVEAATPGATKTRRRNKWNFRPPGADGESYAMLTARVTPWLDGLSKPTVCVTHGGILRVLFRLHGGLGDGEAANLAVPQDRVLRLAAGRLEWL